MITKPCAKINLGLNVVGVRPDGYHDIETVFYPVPVYDMIEMCKMDDSFTSAYRADIKTTGATVDCDDQKNLVVKAYNLLADDYKLPRMHIHLYKNIPMQAGMGGGSADCAYAITLLNRQYGLGLSLDEMRRYAARLGADCAFFINPQPSYADGIGDRLRPADVSLSGYHIAVVKPPVAVSTALAYAKIAPAHPAICCREVVKQPVETWKDNLSNDFEKPIFDIYPELAAIKQHLYDRGAVFAMMSGSGSAMFGIFDRIPDQLANDFPDCRTITEQL